MSNKETPKEKPSFHRVAPEQQPADPIFFRTIDVKQDGILVYYGRMAPRARYEVARITSDRGLGHGMRGVLRVEKMNDIVHLRMVEADRLKFPWMPEMIKRAFGYLQGSARWRLQRG